MRRSAIYCTLLLSAAPSVTLATTYSVAPDGSGDFPTIQQAIDAAFAGDVIELTNGIFVGVGNRDIDFLGKAITVRSASGDPSSCTIDCQASDLYPRRAFLFHLGEGPASVLEGITITNGYVSGGVYPENCGGGLQCLSASPTISNCVFLGNTATGTDSYDGGFGGGLFSTDASPTLLDCTFDSNWAYKGGGARCNGSTSIRIVRCDFIDNTGVHVGGGFLNKEAKVTLIDCRFLGNDSEKGGGMHCWDAWPDSIISCEFAGNHAQHHGGGLYFASGSTSLVRDCVFANNWADQDAGAIFCYTGSAPNISNCTIHANGCGNHGGGISCWSTSAPIIENTIVTSSVQGEAVYCDATSSALLSCCDLYDNAAGDWVGHIADQFEVDGNISLDPLYCDPEGQDLSLQALSPCAPHSPPNGECDLIGALPVSCGPHQYIVEADGGGDYATIQSAVDASEDGGVIILGDGRFVGPGNRDIDLLGKAITIRSLSDDANTCILDCQGSEGDPHRGFRFHSGETSASMLLAVTVRGGWQCDSGGRGGAVLCEGSSPRLIRCVLDDNAAELGGAIWCDGLSVASLEDCVISGNTADYGGGLGCDFAMPACTQCSFVGNAAIGTATEGGAIECWNYASVVLDNCIVAFSPQGQAVRCHGSSAAALQCSDMFGNAGGDWVGAVADQYGLNGNFSADPEFCNAEGDNYHLWNYTPCYQQSCGLIGALPVGCWDLQEMDPANLLPNHLGLSVAPNPVSPLTTVTYSLPRGMAGEIEVFDSSGRLVRAYTTRSGSGAVLWSGLGIRGRPASTGVYYARLTAGPNSAIRTVIVVR